MSYSSTSSSSSSSSSSSFPDVYAWFLKLPPIIQWKSDSSMSILLSQPYLNLKVAKNGPSSICFSIVVANFNFPISLWTSKPIKLSNDLIMSTRLVNEEIMFPLLTNIIQDELKYCPNSNENVSRIDHDRELVIINNFKDVMAMIINISFLTLTFLICVYDAPKDIRSECLNILKGQLACSCSRETMKIFVGLLGSNLEEQWIRTMNLAITNWLSENQTAIRTYPSLCHFSYAMSTSGLWKVQVYCPVIDMDIESSTYYPSPRPPSPPDERLWFSLNYHQLECVIQLNYKMVVRDTWIDVIVNIDNIRCDVTRLIDETLMRERGAGTTEKYFPSRISLQLTPTLETSSVLSISVSKSSENPTREISMEKSIQGSFDPNSFLGLSVSAGETMSMSLRPWMFEQSAHGNSVDLNWFLHDSMDGREVFSSKPSKMAMFQPKAWFRHRYSKVYRPFTRKGGVIFAQDEYGEQVCWKLKKKNASIGESMDWELNGRIWLTYWPNKHKTLYTETKYMRFREILKLTLP